MKGRGESMKKILVMLLIASMALSGVACSRQAEPVKQDSGTKAEQSPASSQKSEQKAQQNISVVTGPVGGSMYVISGAWADIVNKTSPYIQVTNQVGGGSAYCARVLGNKEADFAMVGNDVAYYARNGEDVFEGEAIDNLVCIGALYAEGFHTIVRKNSGLESIEDIVANKKSTTVGPPGSGTLTNSERVLEAYGLTFDDVKAKQLDFAESAEAIRDGHVDAAFYMTGVPYGPVTDISITQPIHVFGLSQEAIDKLLEKYPFLVSIHYPENTYEGTGGFDTVAVRMLITTTTDVDDETVYDLTKMLVENIDQIAATHSCGTTISKDRLLDGLSIPLHPGAERYYKEIGMFK